ncbi:MAG: hypothetical protein FD172_3348 [Methylocystaceae bacterium]|nr:MAG: hypothetical protein FD172_3348 [Methylocystaceae bacterium]
MPSLVPNWRAGQDKDANAYLIEIALRHLFANASRLIRSLSALLRRAANPGDREGSRWAGMRMHRISTQMMTELSASSKLIAEWDFLCMLRDEGRRSAQEFLDLHERDVGVHSTFDLDALLEGI